MKPDGKGKKIVESGEWRVEDYSLSMTSTGSMPAARHAG